MTLWIIIAALVVLAAVMITFFWRATRIPINRDADHNSWKRPDQGSGMGGGLR